MASPVATQKLGAFNLASGKSSVSFDKYGVVQKPQAETGKAVALAASKPLPMVKQKPNDYTKMEKEEYSKSPKLNLNVSYSNFEKLKPATGTPGFIVKYDLGTAHDVTSHVDRYSKDSTLLTRTAIMRDGYKVSDIMAGTQKGERRLYTPEGKLLYREAKDGKEYDYHYSYRNHKEGELLSITAQDKKGYTQTFYNGKTTPDSIISKKWEGKAVRIK